MASETVSAALIEFLILWPIQIYMVTRPWHLKSLWFDSHSIISWNTQHSRLLSFFLWLFFINLILKHSSFVPIRQFLYEGIPQDFVLNPNLFNIYQLKHLNTVLQNNVNILFCTDDITLYSIDSHLSFYVTRLCWM